MGMSNLERAKQFACGFDPLKGFAEEISNQITISENVPKAELSEDRKDKLDELIKTAEIGDMLTVIYYKNGGYRKIDGMLSLLDKTDKKMRIVNTIITFDSIYDIDKN